MQIKHERTFWYTVARIIGYILSHTVFPLGILHDMEYFSLSAPFIVLSNHKSWLDPFALALPCKNYELRFMGKSELGKSPIFRYFLNKLHMISVSRHETDIAAMRSSVNLLHSGYALAIFPEGTRHQPSMMQEVQTGAAVLALRSKVPLLPVYIHGKIRLFHVTHVLHTLAPQFQLTTCAQKELTAI